jgi:hypothetical protein
MRRASSGTLEVAPSRAMGRAHALKVRAARGTGNANPSSTASHPARSPPQLRGRTPSSRRRRHRDPRLPRSCERRDHRPVPRHKHEAETRCARRVLASSGPYTKDGEPMAPDVRPARLPLVAMIRLLHGRRYLEPVGCAVRHEQADRRRAPDNDRLRIRCAQQRAHGDPAGQDPGRPRLSSRGDAASAPPP